MKTSHLSKGFTLIELLIVVAIIAILAAIAVPNFLESQVRAKNARVLSDMRTIRVGLESYYVDNNRYPETDLGIDQLQNNNRRSIYRLTTPITYLTSMPASPFKENYGTGGQPKIASLVKTYLYVRKLGVPGLTTPPGNASLYAPDTDNNYVLDRTAYLEVGPGNPLVVAQLAGGGEWLLKSVGPDNVDDRDAANPENAGHTARIYDPTNGTISRGDVVTFSDRGGSAK